jgi:molybdopterin-guanine dinucleotide biosynthesis protein B
VIKRVCGLAGWSNSGKTTLMERLLPELAGRGLSVSTVKHAHHDFDIDKPGKDSHRHRMAGAREVMISSANRWALMHEGQGAREPELAELLARLAPVDLVMVEGFRAYPHPKLEVYRAANGKPMLYPDDRHIFAIASDRPLDGVAVPVLDLDDAAAIVDMMIERFDLAAPERARARGT